MPLRFAGCTLDPDARRLFRGDTEIHLSPKAFEVLLALVENRPRALSKQDLLDRVWPDVFVSEVSVARAVNEIREGLGESPRSGRVVRTVHAYGYAFAADVETAEPPSSPGQRAVCRLVSRDREYGLGDGAHLIGRDASADIELDSPKVSRRHARVTVRGGEAVVEDLGSKNGTLVNGSRLEAPHVLAPGDGIRIGGFVLQFARDRREGPTETELTDPQVPAK